MPPEYDRCHHLQRNLDYCNAPAVVTVDYANGTGACEKHIGPVLLWCMGKNGRGELPDNIMRVFPTYLWSDRENWSHQ